MKQTYLELRVRLLILVGLFFCLSLESRSQNAVYPIEQAIKANKLKRGGYSTFEEFLNNSPAITDSFYLELKVRDTKGWEGTTQVIPRKVEKDKKLKRIWGFSDGTDVYIFHQVEFFPVAFRGGSFYFVGYDLMDDGGATGAAVAGGAIGGSIYAAAQKNKSVGYEIDKQTGLPIHPEEKAALDLSRKNHFIIYRRSKKEDPEELVFTISDSLTYSFGPDSYVNLAFEPNIPVKVCASVEEKKCILVQFSEDEDISFISLSLPEGTNEPLIEQPTESKGYFEYYKVEKKQDKRGKQEPISKP